MFQISGLGEKEFCDKRHFPHCSTQVIEQPPLKQGVLLLPLASPFYYSAGIVINDVISVADVDTLRIARRS